MQGLALERATIRDLFGHHGHNCCTHDARMFDHAD